MTQQGEGNEREIQVGDAGAFTVPGGVVLDVPAGAVLTMPQAREYGQQLVQLALTI